MKRMIQERIVAAAVALIFMALVRPDRVPELWQSGMITIAIYECVLLWFRIGRKQKRERIARENAEIRRIEGRRLAMELFREVV